MARIETNLLRGLTIAALLASACGEARGSGQPVLPAPATPTILPAYPEVVESVTAFPTTARIEAPTWTPTLYATYAPEPTATYEPTLAPEIFEVGVEVAGEIQVGETTIEMDFTPVIFNAENTVRFNNHEGNLALVTLADKYQNEIYQIHDGQSGWRDLPAEALRKFLQEEGESDEAQMAKLIGSQVDFDQNGDGQAWVVAAVQEVAHEDVGVFAADAWSVVDRLVEFTVRDGVPSYFDEAKAGGGKIFVFCGRTDDRSQPDWYKYTRYAMLLVPER